MPDGLNKVMVIGNVGRDPEMRFTANGNAMTTFSLAVNRSYGTDDGRREETEWFNIVTWSKLAELLGQHLQKGRKIYVEGRLTNRSWDGQDGQKHYRTEVIAQQVLFLDRPPGSGEGGGWSGGSQAGDLEPEDLPFE